MFTAVMLAKQGYYGGSIEGVLNAQVDHVQTALEYEGFTAAYDMVSMEMNKPEVKR